MTIDMNDMLNSILNELSHLQYVHPGDHDQQLYKEQSSSTACEEEVFPGAYAASHFYLLF